MYTDSENCEFSSHQKWDLSRCSQIVQWVLQKGMQIIKSMIVSYSGSQAVPFCWLSCVSMFLQKLWRGMGHPEVLCSWSALWAYTFCLDWAAQTLHSVQCPLGCVGLLLAPAHLAHCPFPVGKQMPQGILEHLGRTRGLCFHNWIYPAFLTLSAEGFTFASLYPPLAP